MLSALEKVATDQVITVTGSYRSLCLFLNGVRSKTFIIFPPMVTVAPWRIAAVSHIFPSPVGLSTKRAQ